MMLSNLARYWNAFWRLGLLLLLPVALAGCGGSGAGAAGSATLASLSGQSGGDAQVQITSDKSVLPSNRSTPIQLEAVVVDGNGVVLAGRPITWQVTDSVSPSGVRLEGAVTKTDAAGKATASLVLSGDQSNRTVRVKATSSAAEATIDLAVAGTTLAISGPQTVPLNGQPSRFSIALKDSAGLGIPNKTVTVSSTAGNSLSATSIITDLSGQAAVDLVGTIGGADRLTATGMGTATAMSIAVAGEALQVIPAQVDIPIGPSGGTTVQVTYTRAGGIPPGAVVTMFSTRGTVTPASASIASGSATFTVTSNTAGPATLAATVGTTQGSFNARFIATTPASIDLQATPTIVGANSSGQTSERSTLIAVVRDPAGNPVKGQVIAFTNPVDPSGGTIDPVTSITDDAGQATSTFIAGPQPTSPNGVQLRATVVNAPAVAANALLSVSRADLFVRFGFGDKIFKSDDPPIYQEKVAVVVSDSTGNPIRNATVQLRLTPTAYGIGSLCRYDTTLNQCATAGTGNRWAFRGPSTADGGPPLADQRPSEDVGNGTAGSPGYRDGVCQAGEDTNGDGQLTPGNVAVVNSTAITDDNGIAAVTVTYPKQMGLWAQHILEATIKVGGSEGSASQRWWLRVLADDLQNIAVDPAFLYSPFPFTSERRTCP